MLSQQAPETELDQNQTPEPSPSRSSSRSRRPQPKSPQQQQSQSPKPRPKRPGRKLLAFDRRLGARFVAGTDEAGRGSLAGPLVVAGVLLDYQSLRDHRVRPLALLNDSKQLTPAGREQLFRAVLASCSKVSVRAISARRIDANGLHRSNLAAMRAILWELAPPAEVCLVDGFRLGPTAPEHRAVVDGDEKSAAIAAASVIAKVVRDRTMRRLAALYPHYGFSSHVGYITPGHSAVVRERGPSEIHRRSFEARCYAEQVSDSEAD
jgi:ribonuclease HII